MTATENGELPAHPTQYLNEHSGNVESSGGLTKREMFAMAAMQGLCANPFFASQQHEIASNMEGDYYMDPIIAKRSIEIADQLLKALES